MAFVTISIPLTEIGVKGTGAVKRGESAWTSGQDLDNTIIQDGTGKHQHHFGDAEGEVRKP